MFGQHYNTQPAIKHGAKFRTTQLEDLALKTRKNKSTSVL